MPGILIPPESVHHPASRHHIGSAIVVHINGPLPTIGDKLAQDANSAVLVLLPLATRGAWILIPVGSAEQVRPAIAVHVQCGDLLGMVCTQTVGKEGGLRSTIRPVAGSCL